MGKNGINKQVIEGIKKFKENAGIEKAIVFGSYVHGQQTEDSDIDVILISDSFKGKTYLERLKGLWLKWPLDMPVDFIPYTPEEYKESSKKISIAREAEKEGITI